MTYAAFALVMILFGGREATSVVLHFSDRDMCEAAAVQIKRDLKLEGRHTCVPLVGAAARR